MKIKILICSLLVSLFATGCKSPATTKAVVKSSVQIGVTIGVNQYPQAVPYLRVAAPIVCEAAAGTNLQPAWVVEKLDANVDALTQKNPQAALIFNSAFAIYQGLYEAYGADEVSNRAILQSFLAGTCEGILEGLPPVTKSASLRKTPLPPHVGFDSFPNPPPHHP